MPIGRVPPGVSLADSLRVRYADALTAEPIQVGAAVACVDVAGQKRIFLCGATTYADQFIGFAAQSLAAGLKLIVTSGRGSRVVPLVEGGGSLIPNRRVFLSPTPGQVRQTPVPRGPGVFNITVGLSVSTTEMALLTDAKALTP